jgi:hypothetical protein
MRAMLFSLFTLEWHGELRRLPLHAGYKKDHTVPGSQKLVLVGILPQVAVLEAGDQVTWLSDSGNLKIEFDSQRCPFSSNVFQAPAGVQLASGPVRPGTNPGSYKYRLFLNDQIAGHGEILLRAK